VKRAILIVEDDPIMRLGMEQCLSSQGFSITLCEDGTRGVEALEKRRFDLVITDLRLPHFDGLQILKKTKAVSPETGVIVITAYAEIKTSVQAIKEGAFDYLAKPFSNEELLISVDRFFKFRKLENEVLYLRETLKGKTEFENIIGAGPAMKAVFDRISSVADTDVPVLIQGESGTGKELVASAIHRLSRRTGKPFVKINCAAIPETLFESELFGHEKGAFTGAVEARKGKFEFASGGTIFFDEIGDIPLSLQPKLRRVLEENTVTRLGGNSPITVDVRGLYATSRNLKEDVAAKKFREDLFYRINVVPVTLPPLRDRIEDVPPLIDHFLEHFKEKFGKRNAVMTQPAYDALLSYPYPGNVRELKHAVERAVVLVKDGPIDLRHLPDEFAGAREQTPCIAEDLSLDQSLQCFERMKILKALKDSDGRKIEAANMLGISRKVLWKKLKDYGIA
jgi:DNA-binding NtrC family response regulator